MWRRFRPVWLPLYFKIKSGVNDIQADGSFPSGHTVFFVLITTVSFYEPDLFSLHCRIIFVVLAGITAIERVKMGAHFASDVLVGGMVAYGFVAIFYRLDWNENLLYRIFPSDLDYQIRFTLLLTRGQCLAFALNEILQEPISPLLKETVFENNWRRLPHHKNNNEKNVDDYERPLGPSRDFLAPYLALSAVMFWMTPIMLREGLLPLPRDTTRSERFLGSLAILCFILVIVLPLRKGATHYLRHMPYVRLVALVLIYMSMVVFTFFFGHALIHAVQILKWE